MWTYCNYVPFVVLLGEDRNEDKMKAQLSRAATVSALEKLARLVSTSHLFIEAVDDIVVVSATDTYVGASITLDASQVEEGTCLLSFDFVLNYIKSIHADTISFSSEGNSCIIQVGRNKGKIVSFPSDTYTRTIDATDTSLIRVFSLPAQILRSIIEDVAFAAAKMDFLSCVLIKPTASDGLDIVATDGSWMAHRVIPHDKATLDEQICLPSSALKNLVATLPNNDILINCFLSPSRNVAVFGNSHKARNSFFTRTLAGTYPRFQSIYPPSFSLTCSFATKEFEQAVQVASIYNENRMIIEVKDDHLVVRSTQTEIGETSTSVEAAIAGPTCTLYMPPFYVLKMLSHMKDDVCKFSCTPQGGNRAVIFAPKDDRVRYTIMPAA